jgi:hypothetical protein
MNQLPPGIQDILKNGVTSTTAPVPPTAAPIPGGGTPNPESCITDVEGVIKNLNDIFGDTIDVHADQDKFVDFARGRDNPADNDWWRFTRSGKVSLVLGKDATHRGFSDAAPSVTKSDLISFVGARKLFCESISVRNISTVGLGSESDVLIKSSLHQCESKACRHASN